jgi:general stress protein YciG
MAGTGTKGKQGFASMDPEKHGEIARRGGETMHRLGKAHIFTQEEGRAAGRKGQANSRKRRAEAKDHNGKEQ